MPTDQGCPSDPTEVDAELQRKLLAATCEHLGLELPALEQFGLDGLTENHFENLKANGVNVDQIVAAIKAACSVITPLCKVVNGG